MSNLNKKNSGRRIGEVMLEKGLISQEDLSQALEKQVALLKKGYNVRIGEILVSNQALSSPDLIKVMLQEKVRLRVGEILMLMGKISQQQYNVVRNELLMCKNKGIKKTFGEILLEKEFMAPVAYYNFVEERGIKLRLGERLVKEGFINQKQLMLALSEQEISGGLLIDILHDLYFIEKEAFDLLKNREDELGLIEYRLD